MLQMTHIILCRLMVNTAANLSLDNCFLVHSKIKLPAETSSSVSCFLKKNKQVFSVFKKVISCPWQYKKSAVEFCLKDKQKS